MTPKLVGGSGWPAIELHYERGGRCQPRRQISPYENLGAPEKAPRPIVVEHMQTVARRKRTLCRTFSKPSSGLEPENPLLTMELLRQPLATGRSGFGSIWRFSATVCR